MSDLRTAAADPLFYAHHANVDRFWSSWQGTPPNYPKTGLNRIFFFDDVACQWQYIWFADLLDETKFGYYYEQKIQPSPPTPNIHHMEVSHAHWLSAGPVWKSPEELIEKFNTNPAPRLKLVIVDFQISHFDAHLLRFGIFTKPVGSGAQAETFHGYLGQISALSYGTKGRNRNERLSTVIDVTGKLPASLPNPGRLELSVAPLTQDGVTSHKSARLTAKRVEMLSGS